MESTDKIENEVPNLQYQISRARVLPAVYIDAFETRIRLWQMGCIDACRMSSIADLLPINSLPQIPVFGVPFTRHVVESCEK